MSSGSDVMRTRGPAPPLTGGISAPSSSTRTIADAGAYSRLIATTHWPGLRRPTGVVSIAASRSPTEAPSGSSTSTCRPPARSRRPAKSRTVTFIEADARAQQQRLDTGCRVRAGEMEALRVVAAQLGEPRELPGGLDPLRDHAHAERAGHADDRLHDRVVAATVLAEVVHERAVDLELVERVATQVAERRVPGPEVVEQQPHAEPLERLQGLGRGGRLLEQHALRDLQPERARRQPGLAQDRADRARKPVERHLPGGDVDGQPEPAEARLGLPARHLSGRGAQHEL